MKKLIALTLLLPLCSFANEPTKEQTIEFILDRYNHTHPYKEDRGWITKYDKFYIEFFPKDDFCSFSFRREYNEVSSDGIEGIGKTSTTCRASDIDLSSLRISSVPYGLHEYPIIEYHTLRGKSCFYEQSLTYPNGEKSSTSNSLEESWGRGWVFDEENNNANKLLRAFTHYIKLCGGKEELF